MAVGDPQARVARAAAARRFGSAGTTGEPRCATSSGRSSWPGERGSRAPRRSASTRSASLTGCSVSWSRRRSCLGESLELSARSRARPSAILSPLNIAELRCAGVPAPRAAVVFEETLQPFIEISATRRRRLRAREPGRDCPHARRPRPARALIDEGERASPSAATTRGSPPPSSARRISSSPRARSRPRARRSSARSSCGARLNDRRGVGHGARRPRPRRHGRRRLERAERELGDARDALPPGRRPLGAREHAVAHRPTSRSCAGASTTRRRRSRRRCRCSARRGALRWPAHTALSRAEVALARGDLSWPRSASTRPASCTWPRATTAGVARRRRAAAQRR